VRRERKTTTTTTKKKAQPLSEQRDSQDRWNEQNGKGEMKGGGVCVCVWGEFQRVNVRSLSVSPPSEAFTNREVHKEKKTERGWGKASSCDTSRLIGITKRKKKKKLSKSIRNIPCSAR
jgi:hypothetical protein